MAALSAWPAAAGGGRRGVARVVNAVTDLLQAPLASPTGASQHCLAACVSYSCAALFTRGARVAARGHLNPILFP